MIDRPSDPRRTPPPEAAIGFQPDALAIELQPLPRFARITVYLLLALIVAALVGAYLAEVDRIVTARGRLVTSEPMIVVQPLETSIIASIDADVGESVARGQRLATMNATFVEADLQTVRDRIASFDAEIARLRAEIDGADIARRLTGSDPAPAIQGEIYRQRQREYQAQLASIDEVVGRLEATLRTRTADSDWLHRRIGILREVAEMRETLMQQNVGSRLHWLAAQSELIEAQRGLDRNVNELAELSHQLTEQQARREAFRSEWRRRTIEAEIAARRERDALREDLRRQELRNRMVELVAPSDGIVLERADRSVGSVVREAETLFRLVRSDVPLRVDVEIPASDIAHVRLGDTVRIKLEALPFQEHGTLTGRITAIAGDALQREDGPAIRTVYIAHAEIDGAVSLRDVPADFRLIPGMTVAAEISTGRRRVLGYLLNPILGSLDQGLREP